MRVLALGSTSGISCRDLLIALSELYRSDFMPPHCYLVYDLLYEPENADVVVKLSPKGRVESYVLLWRGPYGVALHAWGPDGYALLERVVPRPERAARVVLYDNGEEAERVSRRLLELGFEGVEIKEFYEMLCTEETFAPSQNERLATRLTSSHAKPFEEFMRSRGVELTLEEAQGTLSKRRYYGVIVEGVVVSTAATCVELREIHVVCDVYTRPEFRGRGYAKAVSSAVTRRAVASGAVALLSVGVGNEPAVRLYTKLGYRVVGVRPWVVARPRQRRP